MNGVINGDFTVRVTVDINRMEWSPSPSGTVWRKRVHLVGPPESGQVTSVVRYEPGATFPEHDHPEGEEILVLDGVFSDEHGDWPKGTHLLNPEGFRHAPFSRDGCVLFVKLRQYPGAERTHRVIQTTDLTWTPGARSGVEVKALYEQEGFTDTTRLERWAESHSFERIDYPDGVEMLVIEGQFEDEAGTYGLGSWLRFPVGSNHTPQTSQGCVLYIKEGGFTYLNAGA
jgi:anti-sigma factor ChrR (cupin superfamily)